MITKALVKAIELMSARGGMLCVKHLENGKVEIGHSWGELLSEKRYPNDDKWHFTRWSKMTFEAAKSLHLIRYDLYDDYLEEDQYRLTDKAYDWLDQQS